MARPSRAGSTRLRMPSACVRSFAGSRFPATPSSQWPTMPWGSAASSIPIRAKSPRRLTPESIVLCSSPPSARFNNQILSMVEVSVADGMKTPLNRFRLDGQVAIVTGGGNGIGGDTAELLVEAGAAVALIDRDERAVENTKVALLAPGALV